MVLKLKYSWIFNETHSTNSLKIKIEDDTFDLISTFLSLIIFLYLIYIFYYKVIWKIA